jgi:transposase
MALRTLAPGDPRVCWVRTLPGLGRFFSVLVVHEIGDIHRFATSEKLCSYAGLVPSVHASGGKIFTGASRSRATSGCTGLWSKRFVRR